MYEEYMSGSKIGVGGRLGGKRKSQGKRKIGG